MDAANSSLAAQRSYDNLRDGKFRKFPKTPAWKIISERLITQNKAFTHFEGIIDQNTVDDDSIQDGITLHRTGSQQILHEIVEIPRHGHNQAC
jgi:hypothetical protein